MLRDIPFKAVYRSEDDNILSEFYLPALGCAVSYDRAVGYFSAGMLSYAAEGLSALVRNDGRMRLIFGGEIDQDDTNAIILGYDMREISNKLGERFLETIEGITDALCYGRLEALSWMVASGRLDIKVALTRKGMYHEKIGVISDANGDSVIFQGSANETANALLPDFNFESINVFPSWKSEFTDHSRPYIEGFSTLWENRSKKAVVIEFPEAVRDRLVRIASRISRPPRPEVEQDLWDKWRSRGKDPQDAVGVSEPCIPVTFNGREFVLMNHQRQAMRAWKSNDCQGVLALATGAGKTITSIYGAVKIYESGKRLFLVIAVPYQNLADQWVTTLREFNISPVCCYDRASGWREHLTKCVTMYQTRAMPFVCVVVVNRTLQSDGFQRVLSQIPGELMMFIGDECHHHGSKNFAASLPKQARLRLGLSATPEHYMDHDATARLKGYYGNIVSTYGLEDALRDNVLTPYEYHIVLVDLTDEEAEEYAQLSEQISRLAARMNGENDTSSTQLEMLLFRRARLLGAAANKLIALRELLQGRVPEPMSLFYCGDGSTEEDDSGDQVRQIENVSLLLHKLGWRNSHFTSRESRTDRQAILDDFRLGFIDAMVAIRCLDEGIDVPDCRTAYILASARNPKQFIQRRGRILRKSFGKERARIYDFVVRIPEEIADGAQHERKLLAGELKRVAEFAKLAMNPGDAYHVLEPLLERYDLIHHLA